MEAITQNHHYHAVLARILQHFAEHLTSKSTRPLSERSRLATEIGLDSVQSFELVAVLEDHFDINIPLESVQNVETLGDVAAAVAKLMES